MNGRLVIVVVTIAISLAVGAIATSVAPGGQMPRSAARLYVVHLPVTPGVRRELRKAFLRRNQSLPQSAVVGPLWGRACAEAMRDLVRRKCIEHTRVSGRYYASALFRIRDDPEQNEDFRRLRRTNWTMVSGYGYVAPIPCAVLRSWGRRC
jgi:hypothetical protein